MTNKSQVQKMAERRGFRRRPDTSNVKQLWPDNHDINTVQVVNFTSDGDRLSQRQSGRTEPVGRVLRNRKYRCPFNDSRQTKRLFTPEIKKFLKYWLVRQRYHPYPNRDEKKQLALQTGLTYIQVCNWFANWRRKLKNAGREYCASWGNLIKNYNTRAQGNVEQFSISSNDSIWEQPGLSPLPGEGREALTSTNTTATDHSYSVVQNNTVMSDDSQPQCSQVTSTTIEEEDDHSASGATTQEFEEEGGSPKNSKYKSHIMEKYFHDLRLETYQTTPKESLPHSNTDNVPEHIPYRDEARKTHDTLPVLSKWLESTANFRPTKCYIPWRVSKSDAWRPSPCRGVSQKNHKHNTTVGEESTTPSLVLSPWDLKSHQREELDAAEALTRLSGLQQ